MHLPQVIDYAMLMSATPSAPKTGQTVYGNLLKSSGCKCFLLNGLLRDFRSLLILVALECFDRYDFDYTRI